MKLVGNFKKIFAMLAIAAVFSTVAPVQVFAEDEELITNFVYSSQNSGGIRVQGKDGQDGEDGKKGQDGKSGSNGQSVINVTGDTNASMQIESAKGTNSVKIETSHNVSGDTSSTSTTTKHSATSSQTTTSTSLYSSSSTGTFLALQEALFSLRTVILNYVSLLF